ncbi:centrosomal protein of 162 kDa-like [Xenopus tropicalis]|uniref:Centrosomal protein of 162 kDa n=2 Tax=Xenopus tropicalis TaxID=8364 RepID=A0A8J1JL17_XENTR|nr:centrosomal protein of 162 kDa-like [Xenopus tropicalis]
MSVLQMDFDKTETVLQHDTDSFRSASGFHVDSNAPQSLNMSDAELNMFLKLQNIEQKLNSDQTHSNILREEFLKKEEEFLEKIEDLKTKYEVDLQHRKQENYILLTKLHAMEDKNIKSINKVNLGDPKDPVTDEKIQQIRKEIEKQEKLLHGYQQENERLYQQVKELQIRNKQNEELMFQENQSLKANLLSLREQLSKVTISHQRPQDNSEKCNSQSFTDLLVELRTVQKREANLLDEISRQKQDKQALEVDLMQMRKERDNAPDVYVSGDKSYEMKMMEETYKQEINVLNKKLKWFAESQELLDKDAYRLRDAYEQIEILKMQVEKLKNETGNQSVQQQKRAKERAADAKHIQDLERQVKEMEGIIKRRHPNSILALTFAAAAAPECDDKDSAKKNTIAFLERRVKKLETDLESKDDESKKSLRTMEQQFQKVKIQYESRIKELEELLTHKLINPPQKPFDNSTKAQKFEDELLICKETHQTTIQNLQRQIDLHRKKNLVLENNERKKEANLSDIGTKVEEHSNKDLIAKLSQELIAKRIEIQDLTKTVERLQKERMIMLSVRALAHFCRGRLISPCARALKNPLIKAADKKSSQARTDISALGKRSIRDNMNFPGTLDEKQYHPGTFADIHISDAQAENTALKCEVERLSLKINEQKETFQTLLSQAENTIKRLKEEGSEQASALKLLHQKEVEKLICQHAIDHSSSKVAELSSKTSTQEILIKHLQTQVKELQKDRESLSVYRIREETLQKEVVKLLEELKEAKERYTPEMKDFLALEHKIKYMEKRHLQREQELQQ